MAIHTLEDGKLKPLPKKVITHATAMMRINRCLEKTGAQFRKSKSIHDRIRYGDYYLIDDGKVISHHETIEGFARSLDVLYPHETVAPVPARGAKPKVRRKAAKRSRAK